MPLNRAKYKNFSLIQQLPVPVCLLMRGTPINGSYLVCKWLNQLIPHITYLLGNFTLKRCPYLRVLYLILLFEFKKRERERELVCVLAVFVHKTYGLYISYGIN